jgi:hypothetical protein
VIDDAPENTAFLRHLFQLQFKIVTLFDGSRKLSGVMSVLPLRLFAISCPSLKLSWFGIGNAMRVCGWSLSHFAHFETGSGGLNNRWAGTNLFG